MDKESKKAEKGVQHVFFSSNQCNLCGCLLIMRERVRVVAPAGPKREDAINHFRFSMALLIKEKAVCDHCEAEIIEQIAQGIFEGADFE